MWPERQLDLGNSYETHGRVVAGSIYVEVLNQDILRLDDDTSPELRLDNGKVLDDHILGI